MNPQRAVHRLIAAIALVPHLGFVYRLDRVTRTGRVLDSVYIQLDSIAWC